VLTELPADSVQCVVTSPPYFGLRDYGTASWDGGDVGCDHKGPPHRTQAGFNERYFGRTFAADKQGDLAEPFRQTCGKCGAARIDQQIGLEPTVEAYVAELVAVFREVRRVLRDDGVLFLNLGDSYANDGKWGGSSGGKHVTALHGNSGIGRQKVDTGLKAKDLIGIPWRVAFALQADGWYLRSDIIWAKPNPMPESVRDRPTKAHEYIFLLTKSPRYFWDAEAVKEESITNDPRRPYTSNGAWQLDGRPEKQRHGGKPRDTDASSRNIRSVWTIATAPFAEAHFATFPPALAERCIKAGTSEKGACSACGAPWMRQTDVSYENPGNRTTNGPRSTENRAITAGFAVRLEKRTETTGWQPTCACDAPIAPCVVLDPFAGAGTVGLVAQRLGRQSVLIELSPEYCRMIAKRLGQAPLPLYG
jgi:DNA modification methylase